MWGWGGQTREAGELRKEKEEKIKSSHKIKPR